MVIRETVSQPYEQAILHTRETSATSTAAPIVNAVVTHPLLAHYVFLLRKHHVRKAAVWVNTVGPDIRIFTEVASSREDVLDAVREAEAELVRDLSDSPTLPSPSLPPVFRHALAGRARAEERADFFANDSICRIL